MTNVESDKYGWVRWYRIGMVNETGHKLFGCCIAEHIGPCEYVYHKFMYWAHKPVVALREIVRQCNEEGKKPLDFSRKIVEV